jgi:hypothetical protein
VHRHQDQKTADQQATDAQQAPQQQAPQPATGAQEAPQQPVPPAGEDRLAKIKELGQMRDQGLLTDQEFASEKARVLAT